MRSTWHASLALRYAARNGRTTLVEQTHDGPLMVQKALYPDGDGRCETIVLHPPGGIAGGDSLAIGVDAGERCEVLLTTPGATRWYKANGRSAVQHVSIAARAGAIVEWLPLETIVFDEADAESVLTVDLERGACAAGWEVVVFGRAAMGERFERGRFRQRIELRRDGRLRWAECGDVAGGDPLFSSPIGFSDCTVSGVLWIAGAPAFDARAALAEDPVGRQGAGDIAVTRIDEDLLLARAIGNSSEQVKQSLARAWHGWRPRYADRRVRAPRVWAT